MKEVKELTAVGSIEGVIACMIIEINVNLSASVRRQVLLADKFGEPLHSVQGYHQHQRYQNGVFDSPLPKF